MRILHVFVGILVWVGSIHAQESPILDAKYYHTKCLAESSQNMDSALYYCDIAKQMATSERLDSMVNFINYEIASIYSEQGEFVKSNELCYELLETYQKEQFPSVLLTSIHNLLGINYYYQEECDKAIDQYKKVMKLAAQIGDRELEANAYMNVGICLNELGDLKGEMSNYRIAETIFRAISDSAGIADVLMNMGSLHVSQDEFAQAFDNFNEVERIYQAQDDQLALTQLYINYGGAYKRLGDLTKAEQYASRALELSRLNNYKTDEVYSLLVLTQTYDLMGDYKQAFRHFKDYHNKKERIYNESKAKELKAMEIKYQTTQKENEIKMLAAENELNSQKVRNFRYLTLGGILLALLGMGLFYTDRQKKKLEIGLMNAELDGLRAEITGLMGRDRIWTRESIETSNQQLKIDMSDRELEILELVLNGKSNDMVAKEVHLSVNTIKYHLKNVYSKLGVANRKEAKDLMSQKSADQ